jgi:hypothetical protein
LAAAGTASAADLLASLNNPNINQMLAGESFTDEDVFRTDQSGSTASLFFTVSATSTSADVNAFHIRPDGNYVFSTLFNLSGFGGGNFEDDDLVLYDPDTDTASFLIDGSSFFASTTEDFDGVSQLPNGNYLLSTLGDADVTVGGGLSVLDGDIFEWNPNTNAVSTFLTEADFGGGDVAGLHYLASGNLLVTFNADVADINGTFVNEGDIVEYDPNTKSVVGVYFAETNFTDGDSTNYEFDAIYLIPSPGAAAMLGLAGLTAMRRRR